MGAQAWGCSEGGVRSETTLQEISRLREWMDGLFADQGTNGDEGLV